MTTRALSLLLLFVGALVAAGMLLAMAVSVLDGTSLSGPWLAPALAIVCEVVALYLGRHYILSPPVALTARRAALTIAVSVTLTLAAVLAVIWLVQWISGRSVPVPLLATGLWFVFLWLALRDRSGIRR